MSEPWLETWENAPNRTGPYALRNYSGERVADCMSDDTKAFISAAPDMCRALLAVEASNNLELHVYAKIDVALIKAGLVTHEQRDAARRKLGL